MCIHSFQDFIRDYPEEDKKSNLLDEVHAAAERFGDFPPDRAGEALIMYRLATRQDQYCREYDRHAAHYWASIIETLDEETFQGLVDDEVEFESGLDEFIIQYARQRIGGAILRAAEEMRQVFADIDNLMQEVGEWGPPAPGIN